MDIETIEKKAKENLERDGHCMPVVILYKHNKNKKNDMYFCPLTFKNGEEKEAMRKATRKLVEKWDIDKYWTVMESWISSNVHIDMPRFDYKRKSCSI